jgi:hypothetical protein
MKKATTATKKLIWVLFGIIVISAWVLGSAIQAGAQTHTMKCRESGQQTKVDVIEVGDVPGHIVGVGEQAGVQSCDNGSIASTLAKWIIDLTKGSGKSQFYEIVTYEDGSTTWFKGINTITPNPDGKTSRWEGTFEYVKGTGQFEGIKGKGTYAGKRLVSMPGVAAQYYFEGTGTYTVPSK